MAKTSAERIFGPLRGRRPAAAMPWIAGIFAAGPAEAQSLSEFTFDGAGAPFGDVVWMAVTAGTALAAMAAFALFLRARRDDKLQTSQSELLSLRAALDRTEALLEADDQRTIVWELAVALPQVFGGLPERVGAPADKAQFLAFRIWLSPEGAEELEAVTERLRHQGEPFQIAVRSHSGAFWKRLAGRVAGVTCCGCAS